MPEEAKRARAEKRKFTNNRRRGEISGRTVTEWATQWLETAGQQGIPGFNIGKRQWRFHPDKIAEWLLGRIPAGEFDGLQEQNPH